MENRLKSLISYLVMKYIPNTLVNLTEEEEEVYVVQVLLKHFLRQIDEARRICRLLNKEREWLKEDS